MLSAPGLLLLSVVTIGLVAVAWLAPVVTQPLSGIRRSVAALPGCAALGVAALAAGIAYDVPGAEAVAYPLPTFLNLRTMVRLTLVLGGVTAFGALRGIVDDAAVATWSQANWDVPPGTGYLPALVLILCGVGVAVVTLRDARAKRSAPAALQQVQ